VADALPLGAFDESRGGRSLSRAVALAWWKAWWVLAALGAHDALSFDVTSCAARIPGRPLPATVRAAHLAEKSLRLFRICSACSWACGP
jgi:hypothetical protein